MAGKITPKRKGLITISYRNYACDLHNYDKDRNPINPPYKKKGDQYIGVDFFGHNCSASRPCDSEEEMKKKINQIIESHKDHKIKIEDLR